MVSSTILQLQIVVANLNIRQEIRYAIFIFQFLSSHGGALCVNFNTMVRNHGIVWCAVYNKEIKEFPKHLNYSLDNCRIFTNFLVKIVFSIMFINCTFKVNMDLVSLRGI